MAIIGREDIGVTGFDIPAIDIYYYYTTSKDNLEITPIPPHRRYKAGGFYWGDGGQRINRHE